MAAMAPQLATFHHTLAPRWHAPHGPARTADTCGAIGEFQAGAQAILAAPAPGGANPASWSTSGRQLVDAVAALAAACKASDAAAFEPAFERVHSEFHHAIEASGAHH
jgi:hypothetical protein